MNTFLRNALIITLVVSVVGTARSEDSVSTVPGQIVDLAVADSGKLIVVQISGDELLHVFDPLKKDFVGEINTQAADCVFGAGGKSLVFYRPTDSVLESWNLETLSQVESVEFFDPGPILRIVMGSANGDEFFVRATTGSGALDRTVLQLLNARTLRPISRQTSGTTGHNTSYRDFVHYRSDRFLTKISEWCTSHSPSGVGILVRRDRDFDQFYEHDSAGYLAMADDGHIYTETGKVLTNNPRRNRSQGNQASLVTRGSIPDAKPFPGIGGVFVLGIDENDTIHLLEASSKKQIVELGKLPTGFRPKKSKDQQEKKLRRRQNTEQWAKTTFTLDKRVVFAPENGYILFVPYTNDEIVVRNFDLERAIEGIDGALYITSAPTTMAKSGEKWEYELKAIANSGPLKFSLSKAPQGMDIADTGTVRWTIPSGIKGTADVVLEVADATGQVERQKFTISFR